METLELDDRRRLQAAAEVLEDALAWLLADHPGIQGQPRTTVMDHQLTENGLRLGPEGHLPPAGPPHRRGRGPVRLVDQANAVPRTWR